MRLAISSLACIVHCPNSIRGKRGRPGHRGRPGKDGLPGTQGPRGDRGPQGAQGPPGLIVPPGAKGDPGVTFLAPSIVVPPKSIVMSETGTASFQCAVGGIPQPKVTWLKDNSDLHADQRVFLSPVGLVIKNVTSQDSGMYTCVGGNTLGMAHSSAALSVQGGS